MMDFQNPLSKQSSQNCRCNWRKETEKNVIFKQKQCLPFSSVQSLFHWALYVSWLSYNFWTAFNPFLLGVLVWIAAESDVGNRKAKASTEKQRTQGFSCSSSLSINGWSIPITCSEPWRWDSCGAGRELLCCAALWWVLHWCFPALAPLNSASSTFLSRLSSTTV